MTKIAIKSAEDSFFSTLWEIYESSFPLSERRLFDEQIAVFSSSNYFLEAWTDNDNLVGFIGWWNCGNLRYIEHYAINPAQRSSGFGCRLLSQWLAESDVPVLLEIEPVVDKTTQRRQNFYLRLGFKNSDIVHFQPPYHKETGEVYLWLMSYPTLISRESYEGFYLMQREKIMRINDIF